MLAGRGGDDTFHSGRGRDKLTGGEGRDIFYFSVAPGPEIVKTITDFEHGIDTIALSFSALNSLINPSGPLEARYFHIGAEAADSDDHIIYNAANGRLYLDSDGAGGTSQVLMAKLDPHLDVTNTDFTSYLL